MTYTLEEWKAWAHVNAPPGPDREDLAQEALIAVWRVMESPKAGGRYLARVAKNRMMTCLTEDNWTGGSNWTPRKETPVDIYVDTTVPIISPSSIPGSDAHLDSLTPSLSPAELATLAELDRAEVIEFDQTRCVRPSCDRERKSRAAELCGTHYQQERRRKPRPKARAVKLCAEPDCERKHYARGLCNPHYQQQRAQRFD